MAYARRFLVDQRELSKQERGVLQKLIAAAELVAPLYEKQKNQEYPGANFYPFNATKQEIEKAAKKNPDILSPYTFVERKGKKLVAVPYSKKFNKELTQIAKILKEAAALSTDKKLKAYLAARARDLLQDNFDKSNTLWLETGQSKIGCVIGPFDRYHDKLFFQKRLYTSYVGILDKKRTEEIDKFRQAILVGEKRHLPGAKQAKIPRMKVRVGHTAILSGFAADFLFVSDNLPSSADLYLIKKKGTISTIFYPLLQWRFSTWIWPIYNVIFSSDLQRRFSQEDIEDAFLRISAFSEITRSVMRYDDAAPRLQELFPYFDEIYADVLTIKAASLLYLKGTLTEKELQAILVAEICQGFYYLGCLDKWPHLQTNAVGYALLLDFLLRGNALEKQEGRFTFNFQKAFIAVDELSNVLEYYLSIGSRKDAEEFLGKFKAKEVLEKFAPQLNEILLHQQKQTNSV